MMNLDQILEEIKKVSNENLEDKYKKHIIGNLYSLYYERCEMMGITEGNNEFIIDYEPETNIVDYTKVRDIVNYYKKNKYMSIDQANYLLDWTTHNTRRFISELGININGNSLDGFCELAQFVTLYPLEKMGFKVTKNTAKKDFDYNLNHSFGTISLNINENNKINEEHFLIDTTYIQFFTKDKCNRGMYYYNDQKPSPGYFVKNKIVANKIINKGYIKLNKEIAKEYGEPFYLSSLEINEKPTKKIDYYNNIINSNEDYSYSKDELEDDDINKMFR